jgi:glycosyltransferase involved in cell wall biosynthesis
MPITLVFVVNTAAFFISHRLPIALEAKRRGYHVELITGQAGSAEMDATAASTLSEAGIPHTQVGFTSAGVNPFTEAWSIFRLVRSLHHIKPDILHCTTPKGIVYGGLAARFARIPALVLAQSGMGYAYTSTGKTSLLRSVLKSIISRLARIAYAHPNIRVIVQNCDDQESLIKSGNICKEKVTLIPGSGIKLQDYTEANIEAKKNLILFPARMLLDKGVVECIDAARRLKQVVPEWQFVLAGTADHANPSCVSPKQMQAWHAEGIINWLGYVSDMLPLYAEASIVCLPSYREGMPKALLEAAAAGCAVVTTDTVGCREAIIPRKTGDLVPIRDSDALYHSLLALVKDKERRVDYARAGRALAIKKFGIDAVVEKTLTVYQAALTGSFNSVDQECY